ncbi:MAG: hypothetical protein O7B99_03290 [Planctomycetota bacterium]|nr:hypothetical protein [Planctomycetota bacterium]
MKTIGRSLLVLTLGLVTSCVGSSVQHVARPDLSVELEDLGKCRIYYVRTGGLYGSRMIVHVYHGDKQIGSIRDGDFLCWERRPGRTLVKVELEKREIEQRVGGMKSTESFLDLLCEPGEVYYCGIDLQMAGARPKISLLSEKEGRELVSDQSPAPVD